MDCECWAIQMTRASIGRRFIFQHESRCAAMSDQISLRIVGVEQRDEVDGTHYLTIHTTRGPLQMIFHPAAQPGRAALCVSGASGGFVGPGRLYEKLGAELPMSG